MTNREDSFAPSDGPPRAVPFYPIKSDLLEATSCIKHAEPTRHSLKPPSEEPFGVRPRKRVLLTAERHDSASGPPFRSLGRNYSGQVVGVRLMLLAEI